MAGTEARLLRFDEFTLDFDRRILCRGAERVRLTVKPMDTLIYLVENRGKTVEKESLMEAVWANTFVTEDNLVHAIREIRRALGDDREKPRFIQTIPRHGYRFIGQLKEEVGSPVGGATHLLSEAVASSHPEISVRRRLPSQIAIGVAAVLLIGSATAWLYLARNHSGREQKSSASIGSPRLRYLTPGVTSAIKPVFSNDGKFILYVSSESGISGVLDLYVRPVDEGNAVRITDQIHASGDMPVFTADGSHVVFSRYRSGSGTSLPDLWIVPVSGGRPKVFIAEASGAGFSRDGRWVAYTKYLGATAELWLSPTADLASHRTLASPGFTPRWSRDGEWIAYSTGDPNQNPGCIWIVSPSTLERRQLTTRPEQTYGLDWAADSRSVIYAPKTSASHAAYHLPRVPIDGSDPQPLVTGVGEYVSPSVSPDGTAVIFCFLAPVRDLIVAPLSLPSEETTVTDGEHHSWPKLSPSGRKVASILRRTGEDECVYVTDLATGAHIKVSDRAAASPVWLDEERLAYLSRDAKHETTEVRIGNMTTGANSVWAVFDGDASWLAFDGSRDRAAVVSTSNRGDQSIILYDAAKKLHHTLTAGGRYAHLRWHADNKTLGWSGPEESADPASSGIWELPSDQGSARRLFPDGYDPVWDEDAKTVYFGRIGEQSGLWRLRIGEQQPVRLRSWGTMRHYDIARGRIVFASEFGRGQIYSLALHEEFRDK